MLNLGQSSPQNHLYSTKKREQIILLSFTTFYYYGLTGLPVVP